MWRLLSMLILHNFSKFVSVRPLITLKIYMSSIDNIPLILHQIEGKFNALEIEKEKLKNPEFFNPILVDKEIARLEDEIVPMKKELISEKNIQRQKDLMRRQITDYIDTIGKRHPLPFSKKQGYIGNYQFYIKPFIDIKSILFNDLKTITSINLNLTIDKEDAVTNEDIFREFLVQQRYEITQANNLFQLFEICRNFIEIIKVKFKG